MDSEEITYTTGDIAKELQVSRTTIINLVKEFSLEVRKNPKNGYRYFTVEDLHHIREIQERIAKVGKEQALRDWHSPKKVTSEAKKEAQRDRELYIHESETLKQSLALQKQYNDHLSNEIQQLKSMIQGLQSSQISKEQVEQIVLEEFPSAIKDVLTEKDNQIEGLKAQMNRLEEFLSSDRDKALLDALRQSQETQKQMATAMMAESQREKKKWWQFWK
ncbi:DUF3967 domain-containing protein [Bacillus songklensis]|uniref:DUF3967 domain-containing protein n=1 Tax=Bacillus songklensis TaxID=1069116 RepID=A0ABV8AZU0_9BACI